jgi:hypothetical protein
MKVAATAARYAVSSFGLAALAVSATVGYIALTREPATAAVRIEADRTMSVSLRFGDIVVTGTSEYDRAVARVREHKERSRTVSIRRRSRVTLRARRRRAGS